MGNVKNDESPRQRFLPVWSRRRLLLTIAAFVVGALITVMAIYLAKDDPDETLQPSLTVGGNVTAGRTFDHARMGSCLAWNLVESDGSISHFHRVSCKEDHRFEVAGIIDLKRYPSRRFSGDSQPLTPSEVESLRRGLCQPLVESYLPKGLDPAGRFRVGILEPTAGAWRSGVRILVCGIEATSLSGANKVFRGRIAEQDQSLIWPNGTCLALEEDGTPGRVVDCSQPHVLEVVSTFPLDKKFPDAYPHVGKQNLYSEKLCTAAATHYVGDAEKLRQSRLVPVWSRISLAGWNAGSRTVVCYLAKPNKAGYAELKGSATGPFTIDGKKPKKLKPLPPKNNQQLPDMHNDPLLQYGVPSGF